MCSFNTQPPEGGWFTVADLVTRFVVSTHSRPKAAGPTVAERETAKMGFNTQPPEGGWSFDWIFKPANFLFQHTAARRRLDFEGNKYTGKGNVSTHSRPKAAGHVCRRSCQRKSVSTHSRPKAAGREVFLETSAGFVSTHSRPKAAGWCVYFRRSRGSVSTHSRPKAAGLKFILMT